MTEQEWLECDEPDKMLNGTRQHWRERQLMLFGCACCRRLWHVFSSPTCRRAIAYAERFADGKATNEGLRRIRHRLSLESPNLLWAESNQHLQAERAAYMAAMDSAGAGKFQEDHPYDGHMLAALKAEVAGFVALAACGRDFVKVDEECKHQCDLLREIFGNPFRPVRVDPIWRTSTVVSVATAIYDDRAFDRLPILADALEDAGCTNADILNHCRLPGEHVRGCWAVDLLLGKQ